VTLSATLPGPSSIFMGWTGGGCFGVEACTVTMVAATTATVTFIPGGTLPSFAGPVVAGSTPITVAHVIDLRQAIDTLRARFNLSPFEWTDPTLTPGVTTARAVHLTELRLALSDVYSALGRTAPTFTTPTIVGGQTVIAAAHIAELRAAVLEVW
jgi:hypothetical protein